MKKIFKRKLILIVIITGLLLFKTNLVLAEDIAGSSAQIKYFIENEEKKILSQNPYLIKWSMRAVFEKYQSPLIEEVDNFILACAIYDLDCYLLPAIAGLESSFGRFIYPNSYNPFGWGGGYIIFSSWGEAIDKVAFGLRNNYINQGAGDIWSIGNIYSESPTWALRVNWFINEFKKEENKIRLFLEKNSVKL